MAHLLPAISPDTLLHLSIQGTSYALRDYTGTLTSGQHRIAAGQPFEAHDAAGQLLTSTAEFKRNCAFEWKVDVYDQGVALTKVDRWQDIITRHNLRLGIGSWSDQPADTTRGHPCRGRTQTEAPPSPSVQVRDGGSVCGRISSARG